MKALRAIGHVFSIIGVTSTVIAVPAFLYAEHKLHDTADGYRYGPGRHLKYYSNLVHRFSRDIDSEAVDMLKKSYDEDVDFYNRLVDEKEDLSNKIRKNGSK
jgi:hypothetical protein